MVSERPAPSMSEFTMLCNRSTEAGLWSCIKITLWLNHVSSCSQGRDVCDLCNTLPGIHFSWSVYDFITCLWIQTALSVWPQICHHNLKVLWSELNFANSSFHNHLKQVLCLYFLPEFHKVKSLHSIFLNLSLWQEPLYGDKKYFWMSFILPSPRMLFPS